MNTSGLLLKGKSAFLCCFIVFTLLGAAVSCTRQKTSPETAVKREILPEKGADPDQEEPSSKKVLLPVLLGSSAKGTKLKYMDGKVLLTEFEEPEQQVSKITYNKEGSPSGIVHYKNSKVTGFTTYYKAENGQVNKAERTVYNDKGTSLIVAGYFLISYNEKEQILLVKAYNKDNQLISEKTRSYTATGNISSMTIKTSSSHQVSYTYDNKNGIFKHVPFAELLFLETANDYLRAGSNNLKGESSAQLPAIDRKFSYQYNTDDYPAEITVKKGNDTENLNITYKTISP